MTDRTPGTGHHAQGDAQATDDAHARPRQFRRGILLTASSTGVVVVSLFAETIIAARVLSTSDYGIYVLFIAVVGFFVTAIDFGLKAAVTQMIASTNPDAKAALANMAVLSRVLVVALAAVIIFLVRGVLSLFDSSGSLLALVLWVPVLLTAMSFDELLLAILQGFQAYDRMAVAQIARTTLRLILSATFLLVLRYGLMSLIYSWVIAYSLGVVYEFLAVPARKRFVLNRPLFADLVRLGLPLQGNRFLWYVSSRVDVLLLGTLAGPGAVAFFSVANKVPDALQRMAESFIAVYFPTVSSLFASRRTNQAHWYLNHSLRLVSFITALGALVAVGFGGQIMHLVFSDKYLASATAFGLLMVAFHTLLVVNLLGYTLTAARNATKSFAANVFLTVSQAVSDWVLIPLLGFLGPAASSNISTTLNLPLNLWLLRRIGVRVELGAITLQTALMLTGCAVYWFIQPNGFLLKSAVIVVYVAACAALGAISVEDLSLAVPERILRRRVNLPAEPAAEGEVAEGAVIS